MPGNRFLHQIREKQMRKVGVPCHDFGLTDRLANPHRLARKAALVLRLQPQFQLAQRHFQPAAILIN